MVMQLLRTVRAPAVACLGLLFSFSIIAAPADDVRNFRLTEKALGQYEKATEAMYEFIAAHPELRNTMDDVGESEDEDEDMAATVKRIDQKAPGLRKAMEKSGMKMEDYFNFTVVLAANMFGLAMAEQFGGVNESELGDTERANLTFMKQHQQRFTAFHQRMQEQYGHLMEDAEEDYEDEYADEYEYEDEYAEEDDGY